jgi:membrane-bound lytic murein transglycosylase D
MLPPVTPSQVAQQGFPVGTPAEAPIATATANDPGSRAPIRDSVARAVAPDSVVVEVARGAMDVFGDSARVVVKMDTLAAGPTWDIDVHSYETTSRVEYYVQYFSGVAKDRIVERLGRGTRYEPMIRQQMRDGGLPEDMYYLALIESGFDPNAYSKAAAVGMWQFMTSTARDMGLRVDWWVDERRDPVRSTGAAVRFIRGLRDQFGSLYLAAAAYNGGPVRIARGLTRYADDLKGTSGDDLFFALADKPYLRGETKEYVPQLIAAALVAKDPTRYGVEIQAQAPFAYDSVWVGPLTPLAAIAKATGASVADIKDLNQHLLRGMTPPRDSAQVRVPIGTAAAFDSAFALLSSAERVGARSVKTKEGETMASIARRAGISTTKLVQFNPSVKRLKNGDLVAGQTLLVPTDGVAQAATPVPDPSIEHFESAADGGTHVVMKGETLGLIAKHNGITVVALMRANALQRDLIFPGQILVLPKK